LASGYKNGQRIVLVLKEHFRGVHFKTDFHAGLDMEVWMGSSVQMDSLIPGSVPRPRYLN
jgi:hypothetical protein